MDLLLGHDGRAGAVVTFREEISAILLDMHEEQKAQGRLLQQLMTVAVDTNAELTTLRARLIEQASTTGQEIHRHETALLDHEARIHKLERNLPEDFELPIIFEPSAE